MQCILCTNYYNHPPPIANSFIKVEAARFCRFYYGCKASKIKEPFRINISISSGWSAIKKNKSWHLNWLLHLAVLPLIIASWFVYILNLSGMRWYMRTRICTKQGFSLPNIQHIKAHKVLRLLTFSIHLQPAFKSQYPHITTGPHYFRSTNFSRHNCFHELLPVKKPTTHEIGLMYNIQNRQ